MGDTAFLTELEAFKEERLAPLVLAGQAALHDRTPGDTKKLLQVALANEMSVAELAATWMPSTKEIDVKLAFAKQAGDEAAHFELVAERLVALGFDPGVFRPLGKNPLFEYLEGLTTTVDRIAAGLFALEAIAYGVNENFIAYCSQRGDTETVRIYREYIQPDEQRHQQLGRVLLGKYATDAASQARAREVVGTVLAIATSARAMAAEKIGTACFPGC